MRKDSQVYPENSGFDRLSWSIGFVIISASAMLFRKFWLTPSFLINLQIRYISMTISYNLDVSSVTTFSFFKLLFRWKGSIWKSVKTELIIWVFFYYVIFCIYRYVLDENSQSTFEKIAAHCDKKLDYIPLQFMLGFFVTVIIDRWKNIFNNMGWIEKYLVLSQVLVFRDISLRVRRRFPNLESIVTAGITHGL
ncbi:unnamed protein product [Strongylus vulgaris]|uniref:Bestrophin homolog n=1 Tax=Strongylus vulgaris TaxID=40348 RepID=A0A3P7LHG5_STRVU|nr:unnamed protein product [Strongylus vulgaris]